MNPSTRPQCRAVLLLLAILLAGCAETGLLADRTKGGPGPSGQAASGYKVGRPYRVDGVWYYPAVDYDYAETGIASWYGPGFQGRATASGERFDMNDLTAAHRTLPLPSFVRVTNLENGRALTLRVNDRGPFAHGRIIDVSRRAAQLLGFAKKGTAKVRVEILPDESRVLAMETGTVESRSGKAEEPRPEAAPAIAVSSEVLPPPASASPKMEVATADPPDPARTTQMAAVRPVAPEPRVSVEPVAPTQIYIQAGAFVQYHNAYRLSVLLSMLGPATVNPAFVGGQQFFRVRLGPIATVEEADRLLERVIDAGHADARIVVQ